MTIDEKFALAQKESKELNEKPSNEVLLQLYSFFKQGTNGDAEGDGPDNPFDFVGKAKFQAWLALKGTSKETAQQNYIDLVEKLKG